MKKPKELGKGEKKKRRNMKDVTKVGGRKERNKGGDEAKR